MILSNNSTLAKTPIKQVPIVSNMDRNRFYQDFVRPEKPVLIRGLTDKWSALNWNSDYFKENEGGLKLAVKMGDVSKGERVPMLTSEYIQLLELHEAKLNNGETPDNPGYLHDVPFFYLFPQFVKDIEPFPTHLFPKWYWPNWHNYIQFFMGATGSLTPLHFDTLCTHNLFFQVVGRKRFILIPAEQKDLCYMEGWRWAKFDPSHPDYKRFPLAKGIEPLEVILEPGDILYIPSGMLHQVHGLSLSISFNIDWHTTSSAWKGVMSWFKGAPKQNIYYNSLCLAGVGGGIPAKYIFPYYKSYLNYVS
ncbi:MAG: cupin-like domain-containing protein [Saprospiraceae bacterium]|nr:cupin-like domain-containing protein [Saprospiraceae bacterium]